MTVPFETGWGSYGVLDWWSVIIAVEGGSTREHPSQSQLPELVRKYLPDLPAGQEVLGENRWRPDVRILRCRAATNRRIPLGF